MGQKQRSPTLRACPRSLPWEKDSQSLPGLKDGLTWRSQTVLVETSVYWPWREGHASKDRLGKVTACPFSLPARCTVTS